VESAAGATEADGSATNFVRERLKKAEQRLAKNHYSAALTQLDLATFDLSHTSSREDFDRLKRLLDEMARVASGRSAKRVLELRQAAEIEIGRREAAPPPRQIRAPAARDDGSTSLSATRPRHHTRAHHDEELHIVAQPSHIKVSRARAGEGSIGFHPVTRKRDGRPKRCDSGRPWEGGDRSRPRTAATEARTAAGQISATGGSFANPRKGEPGTLATACSSSHGARGSAPARDLSTDRCAGT
jgi:hypothetical protein